MKKYLLLIALLCVFDHSAFARGRAPITVLDTCLQKYGSIQFKNIGYGRVKVEFRSSDDYRLLRKFNEELKTFKPSDLCDQVGREVSYQSSNPVQSEKRRVATPEEEADELERLKVALNLYPGKSFSFSHYISKYNTNPEVHISLTISQGRRSSDLQINQDGVRKVLDTLIDEYYETNLDSLQEISRIALLIKSHPRMTETATRQVGKEERGKTVEDIQRMVVGAVKTAHSSHEPGTPDFNRRFLKALSNQYKYYDVKKVEFEKTKREVAEMKKQLAEEEKELDNKKKELALMEEKCAQLRQDIADKKAYLDKGRSNSIEQ